MYLLSSVSIRTLPRSPDSPSSDDEHAVVEPSPGEQFLPAAHPIVQSTSALLGSLLKRRTEEALQAQARSGVCVF
jgi:hypothetical protein